MARTAVRIRSTKISSKYLIATIAALLLVGYLAAFGNRQLSQSQTPAVTLPAYPLPGTPTPGGLLAIDPPTAHPLPGAPGVPLTVSTIPTPVLPRVFKVVGPKGTAGIIRSRTDPGFTSELSMGVQWGYNWNTVYSKTHDVYSSTFPYQVVNDVRSTFRADITSTSLITWNIIIEGGCPGASGYDPSTHVFDPTPAGQAALQACVADIARSQPGWYWMIWNEPDLGLATSTDSDHISPAIAAQYFKTISDTILGADPAARLIIGNVGSEYPLSPTIGCFPQPDGCGVYWLTQFIAAYTTTYGSDPRPAIAGYGMHAYSVAGGSGLGLPDCGNTLITSADGCLLQHFTATILTAVNWVSTTDSGKEVWLTESNWESGNRPRNTWITQTMRLQQMCPQLPALGINRYAWFFGLHPTTESETKLITASLYLSDVHASSTIYTGTLSPAGIEFRNCWPGQP